MTVQYHCCNWVDNNQFVNLLGFLFYSITKMDWEKFNPVQSTSSLIVSRFLVDSKAYFFRTCLKIIKLKKAWIWFESAQFNLIQRLMLRNPSSSRSMRSPTYSLRFLNFLTNYNTEISLRNNRTYQSYMYTLK